MFSFLFPIPIKKLEGVTGRDAPASGISFESNTNIQLPKISPKQMSAPK